MPFTSVPFDPNGPASQLDLENSTYVLVTSKDKSYEFILEYVASHLSSPNQHQSFQVVAGKKKKIWFDTPDLEEESSTLLVGHGLHKFVWENQELHCLRQYVGKPVGVQFDVTFMESIILFGPGLHFESTIHRFIDDIVAKAESTKEGYFALFRWHIRFGMWKETTKAIARTIESVILPRAIKAKLVTDLDDFVSDDTRSFYALHGIPYRRSYLLHGLPGSGKTSLIQAIAGHYQRNLYFLQPTHPEMTDDSLRSAIESVPRNSVVVVEDIDSLFTKDRETKVAKSPLTFSGLLNALDGIGGPDGHIIILTTNFRHRLDEALIRSGRVDVHVQFDSAIPEQMEDMFHSFYPAESLERCKEFAAALVETLGQRVMSTAVLQHYFVSKRRASADEVIANVSEIAQNIDDRTEVADQNDPLDKPATLSSEDETTACFGCAP